MDDIKILTNEELIELLKENNFSMQAIEKKYGLSKMTVSRLLNKRKIDYAEALDSYKRVQKEEYKKNPKLCKHCGKPIPWEKRANDYCSRSCAASENNMKRPRKERRKSDDRINHARERGTKSNSLIKIKSRLCPVCGQENCTNEFCKKHNTQQLKGFVKHLGFDPKTIGTKEVFKEFDRVRQLVYNLYWVEGLSMTELGKKFNYSPKIGFMPQNVLKILEFKEEAALNHRKIIY